MNWNKVITLASATAFLVACGGNKEEKQEVKNVAKVEGKISNPTNNQIFIQNVKGKTDTIQVAEGGAFSYSREVITPGEFLFIYGDQYRPVYLDNGFDLKVAFDGMNFDPSFKFEGKGAKPNNFWTEYIALDSKFNNRFQQTFTLPQASFDSTINAEKEEKMATLSKYISEADHPTFFKNKTADITFDWAYRKYVYPTQYYMLTQSMPEVDSNYYDYVNQLDIQNPEYADNQNFLTFILSYINQNSQNHQLVNPNLTPAYEFAKNNFSGKIRDAVLTKITYGLVSGRPFEAITKTVYEDFSAEVKDADLLTPVKEEFDRWFALSPGQMAPDFTFENENGEMVSLSDLRGKMVYVDVWATWCMPCIKEVPALKEFIETNEYDNLTFLQVSVDRDQAKDKWLQMTEMNGLNATQMFAGDNDKGFGLQYMIKSIPRFMLIDAEGKFISSMAPRPSQTKQLKALIEANL